MGAASTASVARTGKAAIVPLDYGHGRVENSVIYVSRDWKELIPLLRDPAEWLRSVKQPRFRQDPVDRHEWVVESPATVLLEPIRTENIERLFRCALIIGRVAKIGRGSGHEVLEVNVELLAQLQNTLKEFFVETGGFIAEFAIDTHVLLVRYYVPDSPKPAARYSGKVDPPTIAMIKGQHIGSVHFDIGRTITERATAIHDYIVDRNYIIQKLMMSADIGLANSELVDEGSVIVRSAAPRAPSYKFTFKPDTAFEFPTVVMEGASQPKSPTGNIMDMDSATMCCVCVDSNCREDGGIYFLGSAVFKAYCPCPGPGPQPAITNSFVP